MEKQFNSDMKMPNEEVISTSLDGPQNTPATPSLNKIYEDEEVRLYGVWHLDRFWLHARLENPEQHSNHWLYLRIMSSVDEALRSRGIDKYYTLARSHEDFKFLASMGFEFANERADDTLDVMVRSTS